MRRTRVETRARARALQALYAWDLRGEQDLERVASDVWDHLHVSSDERAIARDIVHTIASDGKAIDVALRDVTTNWRLERVGVVERSVLRLAGAELCRGETPPRVIIHEAMKLAERYGSEQSARFVNGVLDALARHMGRL